MNFINSPIAIDCPELSTFPVVVQQGAGLLPVDLESAMDGIDRIIWPFPGQ